MRSLEDTPEQGWAHHGYPLRLFEKNITLISVCLLICCPLAVPVGACELARTYIGSVSHWRLVVKLEIQTHTLKHTQQQPLLLVVLKLVLVLVLPRDG